MAVITNDRRAADGGCRRRAGGVLVTAAALLAASCGGSPGGDAQPPPTITLPGSTGAPPVPCPNDAALVAADAAGGDVLWSRCATAAGGIDVLAATEETVLAAEFSTRGGGIQLLGLDAATGDQRWSTAVTPFNESYERDAFYADGELAGAGTVVFATLDGTRHELVGIELDSGRERWRVDALGTFVAGHDSEVAVALAPGALFETPPDAEQPDLLTVGFDRATGEVRWRRDAGIHDVQAPWGPRTGGGLFVFAQVEPHAEDAAPADVRWATVAIDAATGEQRWRRERGPLVLVAVDAAGGVGLRPADQIGRYVLEGFSASDGDEQWSAELPAGWPVVRAAAGSPVVAAGVDPIPEAGAEAGTEADAAAPSATATGGLTVYDRDGGGGRFRIDGEVRAVAVTGDLVLLSREREVVAVSAADGTFRWSLAFADPFPVVAHEAGGRLFLGSVSGIG